MDVTIALAVHVAAIVLWIGGIAMVTTVVLPAVRRFKSAAARVAFFERVERRFAWQARGTTVLAGSSGFYMVDRLELWPAFGRVEYWWLDAMVLVWLVFTFMLFVAEPLFLDRWFENWAKIAPESTFALVQRLHWLLLVVSLVTVVGAVAGSHGLTLPNRSLGGPERRFSFTRELYSVQSSAGSLDQRRRRGLCIPGGPAVPEDGGGDAR